LTYNLDFLEEVANTQTDDWISTTFGQGTHENIIAALFDEDNAFEGRLN
jgi:hypothetical protein